MAEHALHPQTGDGQPVVRCVNRFTGNAAITANLASEGYRARRKQLSGEMAEEVRPA
jgi:hypothetical protein